MSVSRDEESGSQVELGRVISLVAWVGCHHMLPVGVLTDETLLLDSLSRSLCSGRMGGRGIGPTAGGHLAWKGSVWGSGMPLEVGLPKGRMRE